MDEDKWIGPDQVTVHEKLRQGSRMIWMRPVGDLHIGDLVTFDGSFNCWKVDHFPAGTVLSEPVGRLNLVIVEVKELPSVYKMQAESRTIPLTWERGAKFVFDLRTGKLERIEHPDGKIDDGPFYDERLEDDQ